MIAIKKLCIVGLAVQLGLAAGVRANSQDEGTTHQVIERTVNFEAEWFLSVLDEEGQGLIELDAGVGLSFEAGDRRSSILGCDVYSGLVSRPGNDSRDGWFVIGVAEDGIEGAIWTDDGTWAVRGGARMDGLDRLPISVSRVVHDGDGCSGGVGHETHDAVIGEDRFGVVDGIEMTVNTVAGADSPDSVRVLVVYDDVAESSVGSLSAYVAAMIESANLSYANSGVSPLFLELVAMHRAEPLETDDASLILRELTNRYDSVSDEVHRLRDAYDADLVARLVDISSFCGLAWVRPESETHGFSVSDMDCALGNLTFAHEVGHNFGCAHDPDNAGTSYESYGFGHRWNSSQWRSVMAYSPGSRVPQFSNPAIFYNGGVTGIEGERDNARLLNQTDDLIANFRTGDGSGADCDGDLTADRLQIALDLGLDLNENGLLDACEILANPSLDCDQNGVIDSEQVQPRVRAVIGQVSQFGADTPVLMSSGPLAESVTHVEVVIAAVGDLSSGSEFLTLSFEDGALEFDVFVNGASDCGAPGIRATRTMDLETFALIAQNGFDLEITSTAGVSDSLCTSSMLVVSFEYRTSNPSEDADGNGVLDVCQSPCAVDLNLDGQLDFFDVSAFLTLFAASDLSVDLSGDGVLDFFDVSMYIGAYGAGCP